jgi:hypothetical protein
MNAQKNAIKSFLDTTRKIMVYHFGKALREGRITQKDYDASVDNFDDRSTLILDVFDKQKGGALPKGLPTSLPTSLPEGLPTEIPTTNSLKAAAIGKLPPGMQGLAKISPEQIQAEIDRLMAFRPKDALPDAIEPVVEKSLWIFIPEVRETVKQIVGSFFVLGSLDKLPIFGPLIATAMDVTVAYLPALGATIQNVLPNLVALAPVPYANFIGEAAGYAISAVTMFITIMTQASRGDFMGALEGVAGLLPVFGTTLMTYVNKVNNVYQKIEARRQKIMSSLEQIQALLLFVLPMATKKAQELIVRVLPIFNAIFKASAVYIIRAANIVLDNVQPIVAAAKKRLQKGGRYKRTQKHRRKYKRTLRRKH